MSCGDCSKCCEQIRYYLGNEDEVRWWELHGLAVEEDEDGSWGLIPVRCTKLIDGKCSIYFERPQVCRRYFCAQIKEK
jgi:Fe-S-cluster containining protein